MTRSDDCSCSWTVGQEDAPPSPTCALHGQNGTDAPGEILFWLQRPEKMRVHAYAAMVARIERVIARYRYRYPWRSDPPALVLQLAFAQRRWKELAT